MEKIKTFTNNMSKIVKYIVVIVFALLIFTTFAEVIMRYLFKKPIAWADEMSRYLFVYLSYLGTVLAATKKNGHVNVDAIINLLPKKLKKPITILGQIVSLVIVAVITYYCLVGIRPLSRQLSAGMQIPMMIPYAAIPICFICYFIILVRDILESIGEKESKDLEMGV